MPIAERITDPTCKPVRVDILVPMFNESEGCVRFHRELKTALANVEPYSFRFIYVDDGSTDNTAEQILQLSSEDINVRLLALSRNFGHQAALTAGLDAADADVIIMMDGDGQHPPALIPEMLRLYEAGFDVVQMQRVDAPKSVSSFKRFTSSAFYALLSRLGEIDIGDGVADFRLISREVLDALRQLREYHRFLRGMVPWLGFRRATLPFKAPARFSGSTKYSLKKMLRLAGDGLFSFSLFPLRLGIFLGGLFLLLGCWEILYVATFFLRGSAEKLVPGWSSVIVMLTVSSGVTMVLLGFIGIYVGMIFQEVKARPVYIVRSTQARARADVHGLSNS
ncbi:MAG: glycosyltransferase family 2 protein [Acidobacteriota bacterium]|nr:glycosyltransferase family 2 protein [Acidobacteriota bacterium]